MKDVSNRVQFGFILILMGSSVTFAHEQRNETRETQSVTKISEDWPSPAECEERAKLEQASEVAVNPSPKPKESKWKGKDGIRKVENAFDSPNGHYTALVDQDTINHMKYAHMALPFFKELEIKRLLNMSGDLIRLQNFCNSKLGINANMTLMDLRVLENTSVQLYLDYEDKCKPGVWKLAAFMVAEFKCDSRNQNDD